MHAVAILIKALSEYPSGQGDLTQKLRKAASRNI
jgi:hypothetical protein